VGGGLVGAALGSGLAVVVGAHMKIGIGVSPGALALGVALAAATGLVAGVLPARRAALLEPATALR
jgi:putative ABC transport system permease protein